MSIQEKIDEVMDYFDFDKVAKTMRFLNWNWIIDGIPDSPKIRQQTRLLMNDCYTRLIASGTDEMTISTGGIKVTCYIIKEKPEFDVSFELAQWSTYA